MAQMTGRICDYCKKKYSCKLSAAEGRKTCSRKCQYAKRRSTRVGKQCLACTDSFEVRPSSLRFNASTYCSQKCYATTKSKRWLGNRLRAGIASWNSGTVGLMPNPWNKGEKTGVTPWNKIGEGITPESKLERARFRRTMQQVIFKRDNYTCRMCDARGVPIQVDHIKPWAKFPELRFKESNCRTLCMACHYYITFNKKLPQGVVWGHNLNRGII